MKWIKTIKFFLYKYLIHSRASAGVKRGKRREISPLGAGFESHHVNNRGIVTFCYFSGFVSSAKITLNRVFISLVTQTCVYSGKIIINTSVRQVLIQTRMHVSGLWVFITVQATLLEDNMILRLKK